MIYYFITRFLLAYSDLFFTRSLLKLHVSTWIAPQCWSYFTISRESQSLEWLIFLPVTCNNYKNSFRLNQKWTQTLSFRPDQLFKVTEIKKTLLFFNIVSLYFNTLFNWYINLAIDGTIYPSQHFPFGAAFLCQAEKFWTLLHTITPEEEQIYEQILKDNLVKTR